MWSACFRSQLNHAAATGCCRNQQHIADSQQNRFHKHAKQAVGKLGKLFGQSFTVILRKRSIGAL